MGLPPPAEAADEFPSSRTGIPCWICRHPEAMEWLAQYERDLAAGKCKKMTRQGISDLFRKYLGMPMVSDAPVGNHMRRHRNG